MLAFVRAGFAAALVAVVVRSRHCRRQAVPARRSRRRRDQARSPDQDRSRPGRQAGRGAAPRGRRRVPAQRFPHRHADARPDRRGRARRQRELAAPRARPSCRSAPANDRERTLLLERAATAAYIAYQRTGNRRRGGRQPASCIGRTFADRKLWRPALDALRLSLELREVADVRAHYEKHARAITASACSTTRSMRTPPRRAPASSSPRTLPGKRTDFSPFVAVAGQDKPALSAEDKQLCVEGLKHGERYTVTLRAGLPSTVQETLAKSADFNDLRARPQAVRALHRQGLRAAAHRPARHSGGQRQHHGGERRDLPHRRPQPDRHRARAATSSATSTATTSSG